MLGQIKTALKKVFKRHYRPSNRVLEIGDMGDLQVSESTLLANTPKIVSIEKGLINTDNSLSDCFLSKNKELIELISFGHKNGSRVSVHQNNIHDRYYNSPKLKEVSGSVFSLISGGGANSNYYHWLFDALPRLKILMNSLSEFKVDFYYVPNYFEHGYKQETLDFFNIEANQVIDSKIFPHLRSTKEIIATTHPNYPELAPKWICDFLRKTFLNTNKPLLAEGKPIFISRRRASKRRILNEESILSSLKKIGFQVLLLEELTFLEQITAFSNASVVVSPHGAGLANLVFCKTGTKVVEIFPPNCEFDLYEKISNHVGLNYININGTSLPSETIVNIHSDFLVDKEKLLSLFD